MQSITQTKQNNDVSNTKDILVCNSQRIFKYVTYVILRMTSTSFDIFPYFSIYWNCENCYEIQIENLCMRIIYIYGTFVCLFCVGVTGRALTTKVQCSCFHLLHNSSSYSSSAFSLLLGDSLRWHIHCSEWQALHVHCFAHCARAQAATWNWLSNHFSGDLPFHCNREMYTRDSWIDRARFMGHKNLSKKRKVEN